MSAIPSTSVFTPEDLLSLPDDRRYELVGGKLVEKPVSALSSFVVLVVARILADFVERHGLGAVFEGELTYQCFPRDPALIRRPEVSFIRGDRFEGGRFPEGHMKIAPDLAVEVISPTDKAYDVDDKVEAYLSAGVRLIWVINPVTRTVRVYQPDSPGAVLREQDVLNGVDVVPGFSCAIREVFAKVDSVFARSPRR